MQFAGETALRPLLPGCWNGRTASRAWEQRLEGGEESSGSGL